MATSNELNARGAMRRIIMKAFWMFITSVVSLVTRLGVEKRSVLEKEKVWMALHWSCLRFRAKPAAAMEPNTDPRQPTVRPHSTTTSMMSEVRTTTCMSPFSTPLSMSVAMSSGTIISQTTSPIITSGVMIASRLNSPMCCISTLTTLTLGPSRSCRCH